MVPAEKEFSEEIVPMEEPTPATPAAVSVVPVPSGPSAGAVAPCKSEMRQRHGLPLCVKGLPTDTSARSLAHLFGKHGRVVSARVKKVGLSKHGIVELETSLDVVKCLTNLHKVQWRGKRLVVQQLRKEQPTMEEWPTPPGRNSLLLGPSPHA